MSLLSLAPDHRLRFSGIKRCCSPQRISNHATATLRNLERDGLLVRHYFPEVPPRVEYELSAMGISMLPALEGFTAWIRSNWPAIEQSRQRFDSQAASAQQ